MPDKRDYDLIVIGSGPGGYVAAIRAAQLGLKAVVVEKDKPGGVCLNIGCIPSKALIHQAGVFRAADELEGIGVAVDRSKLDYAKVFAASRAAADALSKGVVFLLKKNNVELITDEARLTGPHEVSLTKAGKKLSARFILLGTGSRPRELKGFEFDEKTVLSSTGLLMLEKLPKSILILGSGYIGMEFAHVMGAFGVEVQVVEMLDRVLPLADEEVAKVLSREFRKRKIKMTVSTKAVAMKRKKGSVEVTLESADGKRSVVSAETEKLLVAVGRVPNTENVGLRAVGVKTEKGFVVTGDYGQTSVPSVYAIGDITATPALAHVASKEGEIAVEHMAGRTGEPRVNLDEIPGVIFTEPQIASFGPTEAQAVERKLDFAKATFPYRGAGKSVAIGRPEGMAKVLYNPKTHEIYAAHVVGAEATELIHELLLARKAELLPGDIATMIHAHPTLSEVVMETMRGAEGWQIHA